MAVSLGAVVLAGGRSSRMGRDKAQLVVDGERLVDRVVRLVGGVAGEVVVAAGDRRRLTPHGAVEVTDPGEGPLAAIAAGLEVVSAPAAAVLAVDQPDPCPELLVALAELRGGAPCAVPAVDGRLQPLHAVWARQALPEIRAALRAGRRSPTRLLAGLPARVVGRDRWARYDAEAVFAVSWNQPDDLDDRVEAVGRGEG